MLEETSGCTTNPTVDTSAKQNSKCSGQTTHCAQGPVMQCRKAEGPLQWIPAVLSSAHPTAVLGESLAAPGYSTAEQAGFGHREISQLGGKALWSIPCAHREVSGSTALLRGQLSKGGRWRRVAGQCQLVPIIASMSWLLHFKAGSSLSPSLPHRSICHWKILSKFWPHPLSVFLHRTEM